MKEWTGEAKTAEAALALGLKKLGLTENQVDMKVLTEHTSGLLSMFGFRRVKVKVTEKARRFERRERSDRGEEFDRSSHSLEYRRGGSKNRREDRIKEEKFSRPGEKDRKGRPVPPTLEDRHRTPKGTSPRVEKNQDRKPQRPPPREGRPGSKQGPSKNGPLISSNKNDAPNRAPAGTVPSFHPSVPPETLLAQWQSLLGWNDLSWTLKPVENHRLTVTLKTSYGERLAGKGGRVLEAFEYLFNLVSSGGDREKPWVSFRVAGFPSAEESRIVDKALFAAFQVRRTAKVFHLDPMTPGQRRAVHQTLAHHPDVETTSEGEGPTRHVVVKPKEKK